MNQLLSQCVGGSTFRDLLYRLMSPDTSRETNTVTLLFCSGTLAGDTDPEQMKEPESESVII